MSRADKRKKFSVSPSKGDTDAGFIMLAVGDVTEEYASKLTADLTELEGAKDGPKMKEALGKLFRGQLAFQRQVASHISDLANKVLELEGLLERAGEREAEANEKIVTMERARESMAVKASRQEMAAKMEIATTQVKLLDINFDKQIDDRKELIHAATHRLRAKIKTSEQPRFRELEKKATLQVLANKTTKRKRKEDGADIWTAPIMLTIPEKQARWEMEDLLRRSKVYPTFHWPKEFLEPMGKMKEELKKKVDDNVNYIRIRPVQVEGKWKIRADVKPKEGSGRFAHAATWEVPPMDGGLRDRVDNWFKPTWAEIVKGRAAAAAASAPSQAATPAAGMEVEEGEGGTAP